MAQSKRSAQSLERKRQSFREWWATNAPTEYGFCWCGCNQQTPLARDTTTKECFRVRGEPNPFMRGHHRRAKDRMSPAEYRAWWQENTSVPYGYCWCGCKEQTALADTNVTAKPTVKGEPKQYKVGHISRTRAHMKPADYKAWWEANIDVPYGYCWCGCGGVPGIAPASDVNQGIVGGCHVRYCQGHFHRKKPHDYLVDPDTGCWIWQRTRIRNPSTGSYYGQTWRNGKKQQAHRAYYEDVYGPQPKANHIHHVCKTTLCVNPGHMQSMPAMEHLRHHTGSASIEQVREVKRLLQGGGITQKAIAARLNLSYHVVNTIKRGITYKDV